MMMPSLCVGLFGPKRAGKSTLLKAFLDNETDPTSEETVETQGLRFAHAQVHKRNGGLNSRGERHHYYRSFGNMLPDKSSALVDDRDAVDDDNEILSGRVLSFVDCPGLMGSIAMMLKGIMMSDVVLILSRPNRETASFWAPPTLEVLAAADLMGKTIVVVQSRTDTASESLLEKHRAQIRRDTHEFIHKHVPIVEVRAGDMSSVAGLCRSMLEDDMMPRVTHTESNMQEALLLIGASYAVVDGPLTDEEMQAETAAAAAGDAIIVVKIYGRLVQGTLSAGDQVEVRPGLTVKGKDGKAVCHPIILKVSSMVHPDPAAGGGVLLALRATATVANGDARQQQLLRGVLAGGLEGHVLGHVGSLPGVYVALKMKFWLVKKMFDPYAKEMRRVKDVELNQELLLIIGTMSTYGKVREIDEVTEEEEADAGGESSRGGKKGKAKANNGKSVKVMRIGGLTPPTCARPGENILICRRLERAWHLIGHGQIIAGVSAQVSHPY